MSEKTAVYSFLEIIGLTKMPECITITITLVINL